MGIWLLAGLTVCIVRPARDTSARSALVTNSLPGIGATNILVHIKDAP